MRPRAVAAGAGGGAWTVRVRVGTPLGQRLEWCALEGAERFAAGGMAGAYALAAAVAGGGAVREGEGLVHARAGGTRAVRLEVALGRPGGAAVAWRGSGAGLRLRVRLPDAADGVLAVDVWGGDERGERWEARALEAAACQVQNLCGRITTAGGGVDLARLRPVLQPRRGGGAGRRELLTVGGSLTIRKGGCVVDFKGARGDAALRAEVDGVGGDARDVRVTTAVVRACLGRCVELRPGRSLVGEGGGGLYRAVYVTDALNDMCTVELHDIAWPRLLPAEAAAALQRGRLWARVSRRGCVLLQAQFPDGGVRWGADMEGHLLGGAAALVARLGALLAGVPWAGGSCI